MDTEESNNKFKIIVGILTLLLIVLAVYTVTLYNENKDTVTILQDQKSNIESELQELIANYDEVIQDNKIKDYSSVYNPFLRILGRVGYSWIIVYWQNGTIPTHLKWEV